MSHRIVALAFGGRVTARLAGRRLEFVGGPISTAIPIVVEWSGDGRDKAAGIASRIKAAGYRVRIVRVRNLKQESQR